MKLNDYKLPFRARTITYVAKEIFIENEWIDHRLVLSALTSIADGEVTYPILSDAVVDWLIYNNVIRWNHHSEKYISSSNIYNFIDLIKRTVSGAQDETN